ncbi:MAG: hypothetical protein RLY45_680 [Actinomycetota bacterium]
MYRHHPSRHPMARAPRALLMLFCATLSLLIPAARDGAVPVAEASAPSLAPSLAPASGAVAVRLAARGDRSPIVVLVQQALMNTGIELVGGADGIFGRYTEAAVRRFQADHGLTADGIVGPATAAALGLRLPETGAIVRRGSSGVIVVLVQQALMSTGIELVGGADGIFGRYTEAAVRRFQADHGLTADGVVGPATAAALGLRLPDATQPPGTSLPPVGSGPVFPTRRTCTFSDTFGAPRPNGRTHEGVDILAPTGSPAYAMYAGTITRITLASSGTIAGNALRLSLADGTYLFYAHLDAIAAGIAVGTTVPAGATIGTIGRTGNASVPHLHLEIHPSGGAATNPYPLVRSLSGCD